MTDENRKKIELIAKEILRHKALYYEGTPEISDASYDHMEQELRQLDPKHEALSLVGTELNKESKIKSLSQSPCFFI